MMMIDDIFQSQFTQKYKPWELIVTSNSHHVEVICKGIQAGLCSADIGVYSLLEVGGILHIPYIRVY